MKALNLTIKYSAKAVKRLAFYVLSFVLAAPLCLSGCNALPSAAHTSQSAIVASASASTSATVTVSPTASPWTFGTVLGNGDIVVNGDVLAAIKTRTYTYTKKPTVLIYHTHATEAFLQNGSYTYKESKAYKTLDNGKNVVHLGDVLKSQLDALGFKVYHDKTNVEPPAIKTAYDRSLAVMKKYKHVNIYIDLHRNAADVNKLLFGNTVAVAGKNCARMFFVVGTGVSVGEGQKKPPKPPDWKANYAFALSLSEAVEGSAVGMMKPIRTKPGYYNQQMGLCLLAEVGNNANTMEEAQNAVQYLAEALDKVVQVKK